MVGRIGRCEGRPKRTHNPEGNCQRCLDPFHDPRPAPTQALTSVRLHQRKPLQASLQTVSLTSVLTSNRTERGSSATKMCADLMMAISFRCGRATEATSWQLRHKKCADLMMAI